SDPGGWMSKQSAPSTSTVSKAGRTLGVVGLLVAALLLTLLFVRPTTVSTGPDQVALHYSDGAFTPRRFQECVASSTRAWDGPGDKHYSYPSSQRNYVFGEGGDRDSVVFV